METLIAIAVVAVIFGIPLLVVLLIRRFTRTRTVSKTVSVINLSQGSDEDFGYVPIRGAVPAESVSQVREEAHESLHEPWEKARGQIMPMLASKEMLECAQTRRPVVLERLGLKVGLMFTVKEEGKPTSVETTAASPLTDPAVKQRLLEAIAAKRGELEKDGVDYDELVKSLEGVEEIHAEGPQPEKSAVLRWLESQQHPSPTGTVKVQQVGAVRTFQRSVSEADLQNWGVSADEALAQAIANLSAAAEALWDFTLASADKGYVRSPNSAAILLPDFSDRVSGALRSRKIAVAVPTPFFLAAVDAGNAKLVERLKATAQKAYSDGPLRITQELVYLPEG